MYNLYFQIDLNNAFGIESSTCECALRNHECHHVAAALLYGWVQLRYMEWSALVTVGHG